VTETEEQEGNVKSTRCYRSIMVTCHLARKSAECKVVFLDTGQGRQVVVLQGGKYSARENVLLSRSVTRLSLLHD
jgi:ethanolamine utilization microcompartment shell protein EutS